MSGIVILKIAITDFFNWIVDNEYFGKVELSALVHDEADIIYPIELHDIVPTGSIDFNLVNIMSISIAEAKRYLLKEQGFDEEQIAKWSRDEILDLYDHYHED